jgi:hypothetical protein
LDSATTKEIAILQRDIAVLTERISAMKEMTEKAFLASEKAITKAEAAQNDHNIRSNEFRGALSDQAKLMSQTMISRPEWDSGHKALGEKIDASNAQISTRASSTDLTALSKLVYIGVGMALLMSFVVPVVMTLLKGK